MTIEYISEFIIILNEELKNTTDINEVDTIEKSYKLLYDKYKDEINDDKSIIPENKEAAIELFESSNLFFESMVIFKRFSLLNKQY